MGELTPDGCTDLCYLLGGAEPVEARHQRSMQARGQRQGRRWNGGGSPLHTAFALRFQYRLCHFLNEERDAIGALNDVLPDAPRQRLVASDLVDQSSDFAVAKAVETECGDVGSSNPRWLEFRPIRDDQQHPK